MLKISGKVKTFNFRLLVIWTLGFIWTFGFGHWNLTDLYAQEKIVAIVNNDIITQKDLNDFINFTRLQLSREYSQQEVEDRINKIKLDMLSKLIEDRLILQEANKEKMKIDDARVKGRLSDLRRRYPSEVQFQQDLVNQGLTLADIEKKIREQLLMYYIIDYKIKSRISISPEEVTDFYNNNKDKFSTPEKREFETISLENQDLAKTFLFNLRAGKKIEELSLKYPVTVDKLEVEKRGELRQDIEEAISGLKAGEMSEPVKTGDKYTIFRLTNVTPPQQLSLSQVQDNIHAILSENKMAESLTKWLDELKAQSYIKILQD